MHALILPNHSIQLPWLMALTQLESRPLSRDATASVLPQYGQNKHLHPEPEIMELDGKRRARVRSESFHHRPVRVHVDVRRRDAEREQEESARTQEAERAGAAAQVDTERIENRTEEESGAASDLGGSRPLDVEVGVSREVPEPPRAEGREDGLVGGRVGEVSDACADEEDAEEGACACEVLLRVG